RGSAPPPSSPPSLTSPAPSPLRPAPPAPAAPSPSSPLSSTSPAPPPLCLAPPAPAAPPPCASLYSLASVVSHSPCFSHRSWLSSPTCATTCLPGSNLGGMRWVHARSLQRGKSDSCKERLQGSNSKADAVFGVNWRTWVGTLPAPARRRCWAGSGLHRRRRRATTPLLLSSVPPSPNGDEHWSRDAVLVRVLPGRSSPSPSSSPARAPGNRSSGAAGEEAPPERSACWATCDDAEERSGAGGRRRRPATRTATAAGTPSGVGWSGWISDGGEFAGYR
ncbi:unnamed protein product, partial [Urochloa humidicola]